MAYMQQNEQRQKEFEEAVIQVDRVTRVSAGGKRLRFRATIVIGNKNGKVGIASAKAAEVSDAVNKAVNKAKKNLITVPIINETIPHRVETSYGAAKIIVKPAPKGSGIIAGGALRVLSELAGIKNISCKILGSHNKLNNLKAGIKAFQSFLDISRKNYQTENKSEKEKDVKQPEKDNKK